jgi:hypothetical protein
MSWLLGIFVAVLCIVFVAGWVGTVMFVIGLVAFLESGSILALGVALVGLAIIFLID